MKQTHVSAIIAFFALMAIAFMFLYMNVDPDYERSPAPAASSISAGSDESSAGPMLQQPGAEIPFNGQQPSLNGTVKQIDGDLITIEVTEQPVDQQGLVKKEYTVQASLAEYVDGDTQPLSASDLANGDTVQVFVADSDNLETVPIVATRIVIYKIQ